MAKRKAEILSEGPSTNGLKKIKHETTVRDKKLNLLGDSDSDSSSGAEDNSDGGVQVEEQPELKINKEFAQRFEHNKKREELHRLEEKFKTATSLTKGQYGDKYDEDSESSNDEDEDDNGFLATEDLDAEISATLQAIRSKDPRVYDEKVTFYKPIKDDGDEDEDEAATQAKKEKPMYLKDYHRENLLQGFTGAEDEGSTPLTYAQEQAELQKSLVKEMHAAAEGESNDEDEDEGFLVPKSKPEPSGHSVHHSRVTRIKVNLDVNTADKDPETFLSNFMAARAWVPSDGARFQPLESDDEDEDERAEKFEAAYNLRFEDPTGSNEMLKSYARDVVAAKSVRREELSGRKKQREMLREKREAENREREEERARLRRLKVEEMQEKLKMIKKAAGLRGKDLNQEELMKFLDDGWEDDTWVSQMDKYFGEEYYAEKEVGSDDSLDPESTEGAGKKKKKIKKPEWDSDIDIQDIIPEFEEEQSTEKVPFTLSDLDDDENEDAEDTNRPKTSKDRQQEKQVKKKAARIERKKIEDLVDSKLEMDLPSTSRQPSRFRYRETSPTSFGLTARDILMAPDASLNQFAGLKKMATFRDAEKKRKDKKNLGKKARLRQWRKETFGNEDGPEVVIGGIVGDDVVMGEGNGKGVDVVEGSRKKKRRSKKHKSVAAIAEE